MVNRFPLLPKPKGFNQPIYPKVPVIYKIVNKINNKIYIGQTIEFRKRMSHHYAALSKNRHCSLYLQNSFNKHSAENFKFIVIEIVELETLLIEREQYWLDLLTPYKVEIGYNIACIAGPSMNTGKSPSEETRKKISETLKKGKYPNARKGIKLTLEERRRVSEGVKKSQIPGMLPQCRKVKITNIETNEIDICESLSFAQRKYGIDRATQRKYSYNNTLYKNLYLIKILHD